MWFWISALKGPDYIGFSVCGLSVEGAALQSARPRSTAHTVGEQAAVRARAY